MNALSGEVVSGEPLSLRLVRRAERWIGTLRRELLDRTIIWNQRQLHRLVTNYVDHYNAHRPHRALQQRAPTAPADHELESPSPTAEIIRLPRCDGPINEYKIAA